MLALVGSLGAPNQQVSHQLPYVVRVCHLYVLYDLPLMLLMVLACFDQLVILIQVWYLNEEEVI